MMNILNCTCDELALYLLKERFNNNEYEATKFLMNTCTSLPNYEKITEQLLNDDDDENVETEVVVEEDDETNINDTLGKEMKINDDNNNETCITLSCIQPRIKMTVSFYEKGVQFTDTKNESFTIINNNNDDDDDNIIDHIIIFPKPEDCRAKKKHITNIILVVFSSKNKKVNNVMYKNKQLTQICFQLPNSNNDNDNKIMDLFYQSLKVSNEKIIRIYNPNNNITNNDNNKTNDFTSHQDSSISTTVANMPFVPCYYGVNDGNLYPTSYGLLFYKPPMFIPRSNLHSIQVMTCSNRYLTLSATTTVIDNNNDDDQQETTTTTTTIEFTNILKQEEDVLQKYIHTVLIPAMEKDVLKGDESNNNDDNNDDNNDVVIAQEEDEDVEYDERRRTLPKRKAANDSRIMVRKRLHKAVADDDNATDDTEDEEDDDDFHSDDDSHDDEDEEANNNQDDEEEEEESDDNEDVMIEVVDEEDVDDGNNDETESEDDE